MGVYGKRDCYDLNAKGLGRINQGTSVGAINAISLAECLSWGGAKGGKAMA